MKKIVSLLVISIIPFMIFSQSELPEFVSSPEKVIKKVKLDMPLEGRKYKNGTGYSLNPKLLEKMPEKVALVSFYSFDPGMTKIQNWSTSTHYITKTTQRNAVGSSGDLALGYFNQSQETLVSAFKEYGINLLMPEEFLDTQAKKDYYENYKVERAKFNAWVSNLGSSSHNMIYGYFDPFKVLDVVNEVYANYTKSGGQYVTKKGNIADNQVWVMDKCGKMVESLGGDLCKNLGVDAVVIVYFTIFSPKENRVQLQNVNLHMFGPNPTKLPEGKDSKFNFFKGKFYCGTRINPEILIWNYNKKKPETQEISFDGFDVIMKAMVQTMGNYLKEGIEKGKK